MNSTAFTPRALRASIIGFSTLAVLLALHGGQAMAQVAVPLDVNGDGVGDFVNKTSGSPQAGGIWAFVDADPNRPSSALVALDPGARADESSAWGAGTGNGGSGYYGIRFLSAAGIHYGWLETYNPILNGRPSFVGGGWTKRAFFNPVPNQPMTIGDDSLVLQVRVNPDNGKLKIRWNTDASSFAGGLRLQTRAMQPGAVWTTVQTIGTGFHAEVNMTAEARIYRVVK